MKRQYVQSERAHFMCPGMHFGMIAELPQSYCEKKMRQTWETLAQAHPFLRALMDWEEPSRKLYYRVTDQSQVQLSFRDVDADLWDDYREIALSDWDVFRSGLLKVYVYPQTDSVKVLLVAHHLLTDGTGLLQLTQEFADAYAEKAATERVEEQLIESIDDLPAGSALAGISRFLIQRANRQWKKENHRVDYRQYLDFARKYAMKHPVEYSVETTDDTALQSIRETCKANGVTVNDWLMAQMYLKNKTDKIIMAADIRKKFAGYRQGSLGNFATAVSVFCNDKTEDMVLKAKNTHKQIYDSMKNNRKWMLVLACYFEIDPDLLDAAAISALGGFDSKAASFVGGNMFGFGGKGSFSMTNLGQIESDTLRTLVFIPPASPAAKATAGVVTLNGVLKTCFAKRSDG